MIRLWLMKKLDYFVGIPLCFLLGTAGRLWSRMVAAEDEREIERILLIKSWGIGNLIILQPVVHGIRERHPKARIVFLTLSPNRGVFDRSPDVDEAVYLDVSGVLRFFASAVRTIRRIRGQSFDWVLDFDQFSRTTALLAWLSGGRRRAGLDTAGQGRGFVYTHRIPYNDHQHTYHTFNDVARMIGVDCRDAPAVPMRLAPGDEERVERLLRDWGVEGGDPIVGIHPGSGENFPQRRWPIDRFAEVGARLHREHGARIVFTGTPAERGLISNALARMPAGSAVDASGSLTFSQLAALMRRCTVFLSNDTAPIHLAAAMGTPCMGFYGPNTPVLYGPRVGPNRVFYKSLPCSPCITNFNAKSSSCNDPVCMKRITVEDVMGEMARMFGQTPDRGENAEYAGAQNA
ncbi:MAG: hypothetical protein A2V83_09680 [Nitrospirae bacterium RBG_16_64_22]|nr:MAG: hypothetical protein A2V83_09680 [Nitrospirae bacterium RBG_16_64_22]